MSQEMKALLKRGRQLNALATFIIVALLGVVGFLMFVLVTETAVSDLWLLRNEFAQVLIPGLLLMVILYMADMHRRLRDRLEATHTALEDAQSELQEAYDRVTFAHEVASIVSDLKRSDVMPTVLRESVAHYDADAAVMVTGDDVEVFATDPAHEDTARRAAMGLAVRSVQTDDTTGHSTPDGAHSIATPIRLKGALHSVVALWRKDRAFTDGESENLRLLARVLELGIENKHLVVELRQQLKGSLTLLTTLIEDRQKDYAGHSSNVANLAVATGRRLGIVGEPMEDLKLAGLVHDLGMLRVPKEILNMRRDLTIQERAEIELHPVAGAQLAKAAGLRPAVQEAILAHHEQVCGHGYPRRLRGRQIPFEARVIAVCDAYDAMTHLRPDRRPLSPLEALAEIERQAGRKFDNEVATAFVDVMNEQLEMSALSGLAGVASGMEGMPQPIMGLTRAC